MDNFKKRIEKIFRSATTEPDALFVFNTEAVDKNFLYITGLTGGVFENCGALIDGDKRVSLFSTELEEELSRGAQAYDDLLVYGDEKERERKIIKSLSPYKRVGVCYNKISHSFYCRLRELVPDIELVDVSDAFRMARMVKSHDEIKKIKRACEIATEVLKEIPPLLKEGITELDLGAEIDYLTKKKGASGAAFKTIVAYSTNTSKPHYEGGSVSLKAGDPVLIDFGAEYMGYNSDVTRVFFTGKPDQELIDLYNTVKRGNEIAISIIKEGEKARFVENRVKEYIDSHERYRGRFIHSLGHSLGLDVHDDSYPIKSFDGMLHTNMVLTVEPGIYLPELYGVRLEDDIVVKNDGCEILTSREKELNCYEI